MSGLGDALLAEGDREAARTAWHEAVAILDRLPHPLADEVRAKLSDLSPGEPGQLTGAATAAR
jgi:predicted negative regulator of RcsB-dependent stress response